PTAWKSPAANASKSTSAAPSKPSWRRLLAMIGEKLGHYRLDAKIGEGGMGVVYRARDEELNRDVAVKVLAASMLDHLGNDHLLREAQTASALNHPNICTIYQI